jgi:hypothetical protein
MVLNRGSGLIWMVNGTLEVAVGDLTGILKPMFGKLPDKRVAATGTGRKVRKVGAGDQTNHRNNTRWRVNAVETEAASALFHDLQPFLATLRCLRVPALNPAREFVLPLQLANRVLLGDLRVGVAGDLRSLDAAAADLLPLADVGSTEGMRPGNGPRRPDGMPRPLAVAPPSTPL